MTSTWGPRLYLLCITGMSLAYTCSLILAYFTFSGYFYLLFHSTCTVWIVEKIKYVHYSNLCIWKYNTSTLTVSIHDAKVVVTVLYRLVCMKNAAVKEHIYIWNVEFLWLVNITTINIVMSARTAKVVMEHTQLWHSWLVDYFPYLET